MNKLRLAKWRTVLSAVGITLMFSSSSAFAAVNTQFASNSQPTRAASTSLDFRVFTSWCDAGPDQAANWQVQLGYCIGYLQGLYWGQVIKSPTAERPYCLPEDLKKSEMVAALDRYATAHPGDLTSGDMSAAETATLVARAFKAHFTCP